MRRHGIRRLPILDRQGVLLGIVAVDDLLEFLAMQLSDLVRAISRDRKQEAVFVSYKELHNSAEERCIFTEGVRTW